MTFGWTTLVNVSNTVSCNNIKTFLIMAPPIIIFPRFQNLLFYSPIWFCQQGRNSLTIKDFLHVGLFLWEENILFSNLGTITKIDLAMEILLIPIFWSDSTKSSVSFKLYLKLKWVARKFKGFFKEVLRVFTENVKGVIRKCKGGFKEVSRVFQGSFKEVSRAFQGGFREISRVFQESFMGV